MTTFMASSINLALPAMGLEYGSSAILASWAITGYILASAVFLLPFGRLADMHGRHYFYRLGTILYTLFTLATTMASSMQMIIAFRLLQGLSSAMIFSTGMAILSAVYPANKRGWALGYSVAVTYLGLTVGPIIGGMMNHYLGWRSIFYLTTVLGLGAVTAIQIWLRGKWGQAKDEKFDVAGSLLYSIGLLAFLYGLSSVTDSFWSPYLVLLGIILLIGFIYWELRVDYPILQVRLFKENSAFAFSNLAAMINYIATFALTFLLSLYLQVVRGYDSQAAGLILLAEPLVMTILSPFAGTLSDRLEPRLVASVGMGCCTLSLFFFIFIGANTAPYLLVLNLLLAGLGFALFGAPNNNAIMGSVPLRLYGIAASTLSTMRLIGQAISMSIATLLITLFIGRVPLTSADHMTFLTCTKVSFVVFTIICLLGLAASLKRGTLHEGGLHQQKDENMADEGNLEVNTTHHPFIDE